MVGAIVSMIDSPLLTSARVPTVILYPCRDRFVGALGFRIAPTKRRSQRPRICGSS